MQVIHALKIVTAQDLFNLPLKTYYLTFDLLCLNGWMPVVMELGDCTGCLISGGWLINLKLPNIIFHDTDGRSLMWMKRLFLSDHNRHNQKGGICFGLRTVYCVM